MPELPEVEVTRMGIAPALIGNRIERVHVGKPLRWPLGVAQSHIVGAEIRAVSRRGKYLILVLDRGVLLIHLGMSGSLLATVESAGELQLHQHFGLDLARGSLRLHDPRRFGAVVWSSSASQGMAAKLLQTVGPEPWDPSLTPQAFWASLRQSAVAIKQMLLAGKLVCGVGNIYASEALFMARVSPKRRSNRVTLVQATALLQAIRRVLSQAIEAGGSTLRDFRNAQGQAGHFQTQSQVYGRAGEPCPVCGDKIRLIRQAQRSTYFCAVCQK